MANKIQAVRGMHDVLPESAAHWQFLEQTVQKILDQYGYQEIRLPVVEKTELFSRSLGEQTDIVTKEMYTFTDRNGDSLTLRPEGTAGCVRAVIEHGLLQGPPLRLWYIGSMFRHERPQKGRTRQFHQIGVETFGMDGPDIDAELIVMCARIWKALGLDDLTLEINSLGSDGTRQTYREALVEYFRSHQNALDEESRARLDKNPLRILDSKNPDIQNLIAEAPVMSEFLDGESAEHFSQLKALLDAMDIAYTVNSRLVRGLDYYNRTVFEWISGRLGAQSAVCSGGRYDGLVKHFGGPEVTASGFAMGLERLVMLLSETPENLPGQIPHIYFIVSSNEAVPEALRLAEELRDTMPSLRVLVHCGGGSFKSQFKKADRSGARIALIMGDNELQARTIGIKPLREEGGQIECSWSELRHTLAEQLSK